MQRSSPRSQKGVESVIKPVENHPKMPRNAQTSAENVEKNRARRWTQARGELCLEGRDAGVIRAAQAVPLAVPEVGEAEGLSKRLKKP